MAKMPNEYRETFVFMHEDKHKALLAVVWAATQLMERREQDTVEACGTDTRCGLCHICNLRRALARLAEFEEG